MTTDDADLAARLKRLRVHGDLGGYNHVEVGFNSRLDALQAAVLRVKLRHLDKWTEGRNRNAARYAQLIEQNGLTDVIKLPTVLPDRRHVFNQFTTRVLNGQRAAVMASLKEQKIGSMVYYPIPLHLQKCFSYLGYQPGDLPEAERACSEVMSLPIYTELPAAIGTRGRGPVRRAWTQGNDPVPTKHRNASAKGSIVTASAEFVSMKRRVSERVLGVFLCCFSEIRSAMREAGCHQE